MTELFEKSIRVLELPQLLERLSQKAVSEAAKERALRLTPSTDADDVRRLQDETDAARALIGLRGSPRHLPAPSAAVCSIPASC